MRNTARIFPFLLTHCKILDILYDFPDAPYLYQSRGKKDQNCALFFLYYLEMKYKFLVYV